MEAVYNIPFQLALGTAWGIIAAVNKVIFVVVLAYLLVYEIIYLGVLCRKIDLGRYLFIRIYSLIAAMIGYLVAKLSLHPPSVSTQISAAI